MTRHVISIRSLLMATLWVAVHMAIGVTSTILLMMICLITFPVTAFALDRSSQKRRWSIAFVFGVMCPTIVAAIIGATDSLDSGPLPPDTAFFSPYRLQQTVWEGIEAGSVGFAVSLFVISLLFTPVVVNSLLKNRWDRYTTDDD